MLTPDTRPLSPAAAAFLLPGQGCASSPAQQVKAEAASGLPDKCHFGESPGRAGVSMSLSSGPFFRLIQIYSDLQAGVGMGLDGFRTPRAGRFPTKRVLSDAKTLPPHPCVSPCRSEGRGHSRGLFPPRRFQSNKQTVHIPPEHTHTPACTSMDTHTHEHTAIHSSEREHTRCRPARTRARHRCARKRGQTNPGARSHGRQARPVPCREERVAASTCRRSTLSTSGPGGKGQTERRPQRHR